MFLQGRKKFYGGSTALLAGQVFIGKPGFAFQIISRKNDRGNTLTILWAMALQSGVQVSKACMEPNSGSLPMHLHHREYRGERHGNVEWRGLASSRDFYRRGEQLWRPWQNRFEA